MPESWMRSVGVAQGMSGKPEALHTDNEVVFGWKSGPQIYIARCPKLETRDALAWIRRRMRDFGKHGGRESFEHAVLRKAIAAQGSAFGLGLKRSLGKVSHGLMEFDTMFSAHSHSAGFTRDALLDALKDEKAVLIKIDRSGKLHFRPAPPGLATNDGKILT